MTTLPKGIIVHKIDDIVKLIGYDSPVKEDVIKEIITQYDNEIASAIVANKIVSIPYIGNFRKNNAKIEFNKKKAAIAIAKKYMSKEDLIEFIKECRRESKEIAKKKDRLNVIMRQNILNNRKKYEKLILRCGKEYADMFILSISCFNVVPFDQDVEDAWQELYRLEDETGNRQVDNG